MVVRKLNRLEKKQSSHGTLADSWLVVLAKSESENLTYAVQARASGFGCQGLHPDFCISSAFGCWTR